MTGGELVIIPDLPSHYSRVQQWSSACENKASIEHMN
jgi:hypothetical protein